ncbi:MAG: hypothetical protein JWO35_65 [Candidatus Saccharibacteria bacterium]|nr:hypothetical protein [Candidatus Saccharibacteria bacterium]
MTNKRYLLIGLLLLSLFGLLMYSVYGNRGEARNYSKVAMNLRNTWQDNSDTYFFNGTYFGRYNLLNNQSDQLSDYLYIASGITSVDWSTQSVIFQTNPSETDRDDITTAAKNFNVSQYSPHWWRYDFTTKQYQLLNFAGINNCDSVTHISEALFACVGPKSANDTSSQLSIYNLPLKTATPLTSTDNSITNVSSDGNGIYYIETRLSLKQTLKTVDLSTRKVQPIYKSEGAITYQRFGETTAIIETPVEKLSITEKSHSEEQNEPAYKQKVSVFKGGQPVLQKTIKSLPLGFAPGNTSTSQFFSDNGALWYIRADSIDKVYGKTKDALEAGDKLFNINNKLFLLRNDGELSSTSGLGKNNYRKPSDFKIDKDNTSTGNSYIDKTQSGTNDAYLFLTDTPVSKQQAEVYKNLAGNGFRPLEFSFKWVVDGADFHAPINPNAVLIQ